MQQRLEQRLTQLKAEFEAGQKQLGDLEAQANALRSTLLRIAGAIQVLEEELSYERGGNGKTKAAQNANTET